ncbi:hypothetical protein PoB_006371700 [Plakobranchus ocellatus]|uniref:Uncharacterized protein n=1 Tax=Plakobranchus ocellatus TaxID=259542 RepID=A0AAV4CZ76_9GAST|nr:hypothetical protein PoB_006371700 [Plakobranchus ocellatus]
MERTVRPFSWLLLVLILPHQREREKRTFYAKLLKMYITRDDVSDEKPKDDVFKSAASLAIVEDDNEGCSCEVSLKPGG